MFNSRWTAEPDKKRPQTREGRERQIRMEELQRKLDQITGYIYDQARALGVDVSEVPCPDRRTWSHLAAGSNAQLPSTAALVMSVPNSLRELAAQEGITDTLEAWFKAAQRQAVATRQGITPPKFTEEDG